MAFLLPWILVLGFGSCSPHLSSPPALSGLLAASDPRWVGADGAFSVPLEQERRLWLFGDTWLGQRPEKLSLVSNSVGIQHGDCARPMEAAWRHAQEGAGPFFVSESARGWLWPAGGLWLEGELYLWFHHLVRVPPGGAWDFAVKGLELLRIRNPRGPPSTWIPEKTFFPWGESDFLVGGSPALSGNTVWLFATRPAEGGRELMVARISARDLAALRMDRWEFLAQKEPQEVWTNRREDAVGLFRGVGTEFTVAEDPRGSGWICVYSPGGISPEILLRRAPSPHGPWSPPQRLYRCPEESGSEALYCYGAKFHPACDEEHLWITYSVNTRDGSFPGGSLAKPRWVRIPR